MVEQEGSGGGGTTTSQINKVLANNPHFIGVFPADDLPSIESVHPNSSLIANYSASKEPGTHWVAILNLNSFNNKNNYNPPKYFDSFGFRADDLDSIVDRTTHFSKYMKEASEHAGYGGHYETSHLEIQQASSDKCGPFAVWAVMTQSLPETPDGTVNPKWREIYRLLDKPNVLDRYIQNITKLYTLK